MAKYTGPKCKLCRREGTKLFLKGERCYTPKCAMDGKRRGYPPGEHGQARKKSTEYGVQLREKMKVRRIYGVLERQFRGYFSKAEAMKGIAGENLLRLLELRLDNVVYRLGFASSRAEARHFVRHRHFLLNGRRVDIPSLLVKPGDEISVIEASKTVERIVEGVNGVERRGLPAWLDLDKKEFKGTVKQEPAREDIGFDVNERLIVELYSK